MRGMLGDHPELNHAYQRFTRDDAFATAAARNMFVDAKVALSASPTARLSIPGAERDVTRTEMERHIAANLDDATDRVLVTS